VEGATGKDAKVEDEDGDFAEAGSGAVENCCDHVFLDSEGWHFSYYRVVQSRGIIGTFINQGERLGIAGTSHMCFPRPQLSISNVTAVITIDNSKAKIIKSAVITSQLDPSRISY